ncbi:MAG TPA: glutamine--tRNA ligase/YqeY domain fusion protein [Myxococcales bacterium]|nr:glutamine--tRNA ligase/YqeY domain fusion protein [Myxococcales bacterium]HIM03212.1 glutamine--tRNA ligase/YqeY domain fusion protein [Myxococcales bacterium]
MSVKEPTDTEKLNDFVRTIIADDVASNKHGGSVVTRFPPEPSGLLHIGHAKAICLDFGVASEFGGRCHLRFDDTNPEVEEDEYVQSIHRDIKWLGFDWGEHFYHASDYFERLYDFAVELIGKGSAYVCDWSSEEIAANRGTLTEPANASPGRSRSVEENLDLFARMRAGEFEEGACVVRAKIDLGSSVLPLRDPTIYRILKTPHHRTGTEWCVYPMYDFAHCLSDSLELITHSLCTLEFIDRRPLYEWFLAQLDVPSNPQQIEFARLNVAYTVTSKRNLKRFVEEGFVSGWDDPRMPTLAGLRRRGYTPESIRNFCKGVGVAKRENLIQVARLEFSVREHLNRIADRRMAVLKPLKVVITNYPEDEIEQLDAINNPEDPGAGSRQVPFSREIYIEQDDFMEDAPKKFFRLSQGREVRLRYAYFVTCNDVIKDDAGNVVELHCTYDPATRGGNSPDGRKVKGTLHWVSAAAGVPAEVRLYDTLLDLEDPSDLEEGKTLLDHVRPNSLETLTDCVVEPILADTPEGTSVQFERLGYYCVDPDSEAGRPVFNRTVTLRDTWAKVAKKK